MKVSKTQTSTPAEPRPTVSSRLKESSPLRRKDTPPRQASRPYARPCGRLSNKRRICRLPSVEEEPEDESLWILEPPKQPSTAPLDLRYM